MITTGRQIAAARALLGWRIVDLAEAARLHRNAVGYWEHRDAIPTGPYLTPAAVRQIIEALKLNGVVCVKDPAPGVQLCEMHNLSTPSLASVGQG